MTFQVRAGSAQRFRRMRSVLLLVVALVVAHDAVYAVRFGPGPDLAHALGGDQHHLHHPALLLMAVGAAIVLGLFAVVRIARLTQRATGLGAGSRDQPSTIELRREWRSIWRFLGPRVVLLLLLQENAEHLFGHGHFEGLSVYLAPESLLSLPVILAVTALIALAGALVRWREEALGRRIRAALARRPRTTTAHRPSPGWGVVAAICRHRWILLRRDLGRAPPLAAAA